jgi:hypothetical protein
MKIYRDGKEIELTAEELRMAYEEKKLEYFAEDVKNSVEGMELDEEFDVGDYETLAYRFDRALGRNDSYWDSYWFTLENVIEDYIREGK